MINEEYQWQCVICEKKFSDAERDEDGNGNKDYAQCYTCDECGEEHLCEECVTIFENAGVSLCKKCLRVPEQVVEKIVEKPNHINSEADIIPQKEETMAEFEKRIMMS